MYKIYMKKRVSLSVVSIDYTLIFMYNNLVSKRGGKEDAHEVQRFSETEP
nr:MAG TPA: hypothetical protein [Caudoviricetes sp.]